ncbi:MAG: hypothetical protein HYZ79_02820 [Candidatus Melainabacteria bacterium]|nr:hypothetical protein [Candidatus Melainabacteria bacterium]
MTNQITKANISTAPIKPANTGQKIGLNLSAEAQFLETKQKYGLAAGVVGGGLAAVSVLGAFIKGASFPSKFLHVLGDVFGSAAALAAPVAQTYNEFKNYSDAKNGSTNGADQGGMFDDYLKLFYRLCSQGLVPFIFERLINPENITKSIWHKGAALLNLPFVAFTGYSWGFGNTQGIIAWVLRKGEEIREAKSKGIQKEERRLRKEGYEKIYNSAERLLTIGSIANPVMPCLQYAADGLHAFTNFVKGDQSIGEFFNRPLLSFSRLLSTLIAVPEAFAKGVDAFMRVVVNERHHLKAVLPNKLNRTIDKWGRDVEEKLAHNGRLRKLKNGSEMVFHALSPFAMISLFAPMLDRPHVSEEAQAQGGGAGFLDKWVGRYAKTLTLVFTGFYVGFGRLPQGIFQSIYFGRKLIGKYIKGEDEKKTQDALIALRQKIYNSSFVSSVSGFARNAIEKLVPNFYETENEYGFPTYRQVLASCSFDQAQADYKCLFDLLKILSIKDNGHDYSDLRREKVNQILSEPGFQRELEFYKKEVELDLSECVEEIVSGEASAKEKIGEKIVQYCLEYSTYECVQGNYDITPEDKIKIEQLVKNKISVFTNDAKKERVAPNFPFALFLARIFLRPLDLQSRLPEWDHDKKVKLAIYQGDEINSAFRNELEVVGAENADCLRRTINRGFGLAA